jgi:hypothetical protein
MQGEQFYSVVSEPELNELLAGRPVGYGLPWPVSLNPPHLTEGSTGVLWRRNNDEGAVQPLTLVVREDQVRRLFGRFAQLRSDLSPLSAWCHVLTPDRFYALHSMVIESDLKGLEAAWSGAVIAEAALLSDKSLSNLRLPACFATYGFGIARAMSLWGRVSIMDIALRIDSANRLLKAEGIGQRNAVRSSKIRSALDPIWQSLLALSSANLGVGTGLAPIVESLRALQRARAQKDPDEARLLATHLRDAIPEADVFTDFQTLTPEQRLRQFDRLVDALNAVGERESFRRNALAMLAGYLSTVAAGGKPSLKLAEGHATRWPEITAWAYTIGGIGEGVFWTSGFDGLGRLVGRELIRPFCLNEPPTCDLVLEEATILVDTKLSDPLVHLRIKQARIATIAIIPGVNISVLVSEAPVDSGKESGRNERQQPFSQVGNRDTGALIADAIWPHIQKRIEDYVKSLQTGSQGGRNKRKTGSQLPLKDL